MEKDIEELRRKEMLKLSKHFKGYGYMQELQERDKAIMPIEGHYNDFNIRINTWKCEICDYKVDEATNFCHHCGQRLIEED